MCWACCISCSHLQVWGAAGHMRRVRNPGTIWSSKGHRPAHKIQFLVHCWIKPYRHPLNFCFIPCSHQVHTCPAGRCGSSTLPAPGSTSPPPGCPRHADAQPMRSMQSAASGRVSGLGRFQVASGRGEGGAAGSRPLHPSCQHHADAQPMRSMQSAASGRVSGLGRFQVASGRGEGGQLVAGRCIQAVSAMQMRSLGERGKAHKMG